MSPKKGDYFNRKYIFQPLIFSGYVSFQGSIGEFAVHTWNTNDPCFDWKFGLVLGGVEISKMERSLGL